MPVTTIIQQELADVVTMRESRKALETQVIDRKSRLAQGARVERGGLRPRVKTMTQTDLTERALRDILGNAAFLQLKARLPVKEIHAFWIDPAGKHLAGDWGIAPWRAQRIYSLVAKGVQPGKLTRLR